MKRKNLVAMGLAGVMAVGMCMPVMAATENQWDSTTTGGKNTTVTRSISAAYTVTIPAELTFADSADKKFSIEASDFLLEPKSTVDVSVNKAVSLAAEKDPNVKLEMTLGIANATEQGDTLALSLAANGSTEVTLADPANIANAGNYKGTVTFNVIYNTPTV